MFKIEKALLISQNSSDIAFINVIKQFLKETNMLVSNIHLTHVNMVDEVGSQFPIDTNLYDGAWYKNILIAAEIIIDRLHSRIDENKDYLKMFNDVHNCDFVEFAKKWNKINFMVKYNLETDEWERLCKEYNIHSTSRKLEEIIAKGVSIDLPLLKSISLEIDKYKSVAKNLNTIGGSDYNNLLSILAPGREDGAQYAKPQEEGVQGVATPVQPQPVRAVSEKGPLSPIKREMDQILKWIKLRDEEIQMYKHRQSKGFDPEEYKLINNKLEQLEKEMKINDELLADAKKMIPLDPAAKDMAQLLRWVKNQEASIRHWKKVQTEGTAKEELKQIEKYLALIEKELGMVNTEIQSARSYIPLDPKAKEMAAILNWIKSRQPDIKAYKKQLVGQTINDELKLIEKELGIAGTKTKEIEATIKYINSNKPVDPYKNELDELLKWINIKTKEIANAKAAERKLLNAKKKELLKAADKAEELVKNEISNIDQELDQSNKILQGDEKAPVKKQILLADSSTKTTDVPKLNVTEEKIYDIADVYKVEAEVLKAAIEILPKELAKAGKKALPKMLQNLLDQGYIEVNENYVPDPKHKYKLKEVEKILVR